MEYNERKERIAWLVDNAPKLTEEDLQKVNESYQSYLFRERKTRKLWTSCCGRSVTLEREDPLLDAPHAAEEKPFGYHHVEPKPKYPCPFCGKPGKVKELGRTGNRKKLFQFSRNIVMKTVDGGLWGIGIHAEKRYGGVEGALTGLPEYEITQIWRFEPGKAEHAARYWAFWYGTGDWNIYDVLTQQDKLLSGWRFPDGFPQCSEWGTRYDLINAPAAKESDVCRYIWPSRKRGMALANMRYFALCALRGRTVEMLQKAGQTEIVEQMCLGYTNGIRWNEETPQKCFGLGKQELKAWLEAGGGAWLLKEYKYAKKRVPASFLELKKLEGLAGTEEAASEVLKTCLRYSLPVEKLNKYLVKNRTCKKGAAMMWKDAVTAAEALGMDMTNPLILMPGNLSAKHDEWTRTAELCGKTGEDKKVRERLRKLTRKYTYTDGTLLIRPPVSCGEITAEGKKLRHCVGGYADRHASGATTILFLRRRDRPGVPLCTIEIRGEHIVQIHGYRNEFVACPDNPKRVDPRKLYGEFLDAWLAWVQDGSKREKKKKGERKTG